MTVAGVSSPVGMAGQVHFMSLMSLLDTHIGIRCSTGSTYGPGLYNEGGQGLATCTKRLLPAMYKVRLVQHTSDYGINALGVCRETWGLVGHEVCSGSYPVTINHLEREEDEMTVPVGSKQKPKCEELSNMAVSL